MLTITGGKQNNDGRLTRRSVLKIGALSAGGLTLADMLRLQSQGAVKSASRHKMVICIDCGVRRCIRTDTISNPTPPANTEASFLPSRPTCLEWRCVN